MGYNSCVGIQAGRNVARDIDAVIERDGFHPDREYRSKNGSKVYYWDWIKWYNGTPEDIDNILVKYDIKTVKEIHKPGPYNPYDEFVKVMVGEETGDVETSSSCSGYEEFMDIYAVEGVHLPGMEMFAVEGDQQAEFYGQLIDSVEDFLEENNVILPRSEEEKAEDPNNDPENTAIIYGSDYDELRIRLAEVMERWKR